MTTQVVSLARRGESNRNFSVGETTLNVGEGGGPDNPHPLSTMRTELVWEGKYDEYGRRRSVDAAA